MDDAEFQDMKKRIEETPAQNRRELEDYLSQTMEQAKRDGNLERADSYKELLRVAWHHPT